MDIIYLSDDSDYGDRGMMSKMLECRCYPMNQRNQREDTNLQLPTSFVIPLSPNKYDQRIKNKFNQKKKKTKELPSKRTEANSAKMIKFMIESSPLI